MDAAGRLSEGPVAFDRYVLDADKRQLLRDGKAVSITPKVLELLAILVAHYPQAVSRDRLYELLWPEGFVEDGNLTQSVYLLRRALDPVSDGRRFIETLPRQGYRFAAQPQPLRERSQRRAAFKTAFLRVAACLIFGGVTLGLAGSALPTGASSLTPQAAAAYALGLYHWNLRTDAELSRSVTYFAQTVRFSPQSPLGYAGLADAYAIEAESTSDPKVTKRDIALAERYRDEALRRDPNNAEAHTVTGFLAYRFQKNYALAEREYQFALHLRPDYATAHQWHAILRFTRGDIEGSMRELEVAHQLEPTSEVISRWLGTVYYYARRPSDAIAVLSETLAIEPYDEEAWIQLASAQEQGGRWADALKTLRRVRRIEPHKDPFVALLEARIRVLEQHGVTDAQTIARMQHLAKNKHVEDGELAYFYVAAGMYEEAIHALRKSAHGYVLDVSMVKYDPRLDPIRSDPRFQRLFY